MRLTRLLLLCAIVLVFAGLAAPVWAETPGQALDAALAKQSADIAAMKAANDALAAQLEGRRFHNGD